MSFALSAKSVSRMNGVDVRIVRIALRAIQITLIDFGIPEHGGKRDSETQRILYNMGKSKCDGTVKISKHQKGKALDFFPYRDGKADYSKEAVAIVACAFLQAAMELGYRIRWGGHFSNFFDGCHIELLED